MYDTTIDKSSDICRLRAKDTCKKLPTALTILAVLMIYLTVAAHTATIDLSEKRGVNPHHTAKSDRQISSLILSGLWDR